MNTQNGSPRSIIDLRYRIRFIMDRWVVFFPLRTGCMPFETLPAAFKWIGRHSALVAKDAEKGGK